MDKETILIFNAQDITIHNYSMCLWRTLKLSWGVCSPVVEYLHMYDKERWGEREEERKERRQKEREREDPEGEEKEKEGNIEGEEERGGREGREREGSDVRGGEEPGN